MDDGELALSNRRWMSDLWEDSLGQLYLFLLLIVTFLKCMLPFPYFMEDIFLGKSSQAHSQELAIIPISPSEVTPPNLINHEVYHANSSTTLRLVEIELAIEPA